ncbi:MAG: hypothetical protein ABSF00_01180 [Candidatus Bathyarchaeia archaeon]
MGKTLTKKCGYALLIIALTVGIVAVATNGSLVLADLCTAQIGYPVMAAQQYYGSNVQVTVPVSATCSFYAGQLYAVGTAYDATYNSNVGTANTALNAINGGNSFSGQLQFNLPISTQTHSVQFSVSIYNAQTGYNQPYYGGAPLAIMSETFVVSPSNYQSSYPYNPLYPSYPYYPTYNHYYAPYPHYNPNPGSYYHYYYGNYNRHCNNWKNSCNHH